MLEIGPQVGSEDIGVEYTGRKDGDSGECGRHDITMKGNSGLE